jgi:hypothetical protein
MSDDFERRGCLRSIYAYHNLLLYLYILDEDDYHAPMHVFLGSRLPVYQSRNEGYPAKVEVCQAWFKLDQLFTTTLLYLYHH